MAKIPQPAGALRVELERRLLNGWCVYCRAPAAPDRPLTREHVIPRARGGRRKDVGIIVPACAPCNHHRGCREFVLFLLARPQRIASFLDYLDSLPAECLSQVDRRVIADLYTAIWLLSESILCGIAWRERLRRLCSGRRLHRRRYTARRLVGAVTQRLERLRRRTRQPAGPSCLLRAAAEPAPSLPTESLEELRVGLVTVLARIAESPAEWVLRELASELQRLVPQGSEPPQGGAAEWPDTSQLFATTAEPEPPAKELEEIVSLEGWNQRRQRWRRSRIHRRGGRRARRYAA
ncbi:MAG TPA: HNH endonuclease [Longimicrobiaceae bacterium]|nr:HNH endonuclease [Longimicrobiaceae bacterium]